MAINLIPLIWLYSINKHSAIIRFRSFDIRNPVGHVINFVAINDAYYSAAAVYGKVGTSNRKW